jgi:hypothetical protein
MKQPQIKRASKRKVNVSIQRQGQGIGLNIGSPESLADSVRSALSRIAPERRVGFFNRFLTALRDADVNIGQLMFLLGIPATTLDELTAAEMAQVIRYVRFNDPKAMNELLPVFSDLLAQQAKHKARISKQAA